MDFQFLLAIPIATIFYMWHKSLPPLPPPIYPTFPHRAGCYANGFASDDSFSPFPASSDSDDSDDFHYMHHDNMQDFCAGHSFLDDQLDPAKDYLNYNIYHHDDDHCSHDFSSDMSIHDISQHD